MMQMDRYRECRGIVPRNGRCENDGIRVWPKKGGGFYHDPTEVRLAGEAYRSLEAQAQRKADRANWRERHDL